MLSIIIPTLNEEAYLPPLLDSIDRQAGALEVWIVDGSSDDQTVAVAREFSIRSRHPIFIKVIERSNVARQRNAGALQARYPLLLFLDADVVLPDGFIKESLNTITKNQIELAGTKIFSAEKEFIFRTMYALYSHLYLPFMRLFNPVLHGCSMFVAQRVHNQIGGFPEDVTFEDFKYAKMGSLYTRSVLLRGRYVRTSARRFYNPSLRELAELVLSGVLSMFKAGIKGKGFMTKYHEHAGRHAKPRY